MHVAESETPVQMLLRVLKCARVQVDVPEFNSPLAHIERTEGPCRRKR